MSIPRNAIYQPLEHDLLRRALPEASPYPITDRTEVEECRRALGQDDWLSWSMWRDLERFNQEDSLAE